jgi:predicted GIY-YIG superfamily endonuclease
MPQLPTFLRAGRQAVPPDVLPDEAKLLPVVSRRQAGARAKLHMQVAWFVYIIQSTVDGRLYTGISPDVATRIAKHNAGKGAKTTRRGRPWVLVHTEGPMALGAALRRERAIKKMSREAKLRLIAG